MMLLIGLAACDTPPPISITSHFNNQVVETPTITVAGTVGTHTSLTYSLNGGSRQIIGGISNFSFSVNLVAGLNTISVFAKNGSSSESNATVTVDYKDPTSSSKFNLNASVTGPGTIGSSPSGIACNPTCTASFNSDSTVALTALPSAGATFSGWNGACSGTSPICTLTMDAAKSVGATFSGNSTQSLSVAVVGSGTVISVPGGINCNTTCTASFDSNQPVTLIATPSPNATFSSWSGACTGTTNCTIVMNTAKSVTATFITVSPNTLTITKTGTGTGTVISTPGGINCGSTCSAGFSPNQAVILSATADAGSTFFGWSGACTGAGACMVSMDAAKSVSATFNTNPVNKYTLSVNKLGTGTGTVSSNPAGVACGSGCSGTFDAGTAVTLTATADAGSTFSGWSGACSGSGSCTVSMDGNKAVTATFTLNQYTLSVSKTGSGTVSSIPTGISCGADCSESYSAGTSITLVATPDIGWVFSSWSGACTGNAGCTVQMNQNQSVAATFSQSSYTLAPNYGNPSNVYFAGQKSTSLQYATIGNRSNFTAQAQNFSSLTATSGSIGIGTAANQINVLFQAANSSADSLAFVLVAGSQVPVGDYPITLTATGGGVSASVQATVRVVVCSSGCN